MTDIPLPDAPPPSRDGVLYRLQPTLTLVIAVAIMFSLHWQFTLIVLAVLPRWVWPTIKIGQIQRRLAGNA